MAVVTSDFLAALYTNYRVIWEDEFLAASSASDYKRYATVTPSSTDTESYNWLGSVPKMREWLDERQLSGLTQYTYTIKNKSYEATIEVQRETLEDDKYGQIRPRIAQLAQEAARFPSELALSALYTGHSNAAYDGVNFFATTHAEESSGTQSNLLTGAGGTTLAQIRADFIAARTAMRKFKDGQGRPMNLAPDLIIAPPDLQDLFEQLLNTNIIALSSGTQQTNVLMGAADLFIDPLLSAQSTVDWYLLSTKSPIKPLIFQERKAPEFLALDDPKAEQAFFRKRFFYGVDSRMNVGYGLWQMAIKIDN